MSFAHEILPLVGTSGLNKSRRRPKNRGARFTKKIDLYFLNRYEQIKIILGKFSFTILPFI